MDVCGRVLYYIPVLDADYEEGEVEVLLEALEKADPNPPSHYDREVGSVNEANLVGSRGAIEDTHKPVLDIDFEARLIPSKTEGHYHLYLDGIELEWEDYVELLEVMAKVGILEQGYVNASIERGMTRVRLPDGVGRRPQ